MKKTLLLLAASAVACGSALAAPFTFERFEKAPVGPVENDMIKAPAFAESETPSIQFTYAEDIVTAYSLNGVNRGYIYVAFQIPVADQQPYIGCKISGMSVIAGVNNDRNNPKNPLKVINAFVTDDLSAVPADMTDVTLSDNAFGVNTFDLTTPFEITGAKPIYVGYRFRYISNYYYLPVDNVATPQNVRTCLVANVSSASLKPQYSNFSDQIGSIGITALITGENLPENFAKLSSVDMDGWFALNSPIEYDAYLKNWGVNDISAVKIKSVINNGDVYEKTVSFDTPLKPGKKLPVTVDGISNSVPGLYILNTILTGVNDAATDGSDNIATRYSCYNEGYPRKVVIEEATGNWCQYCTAGLASMDYFAENYPDWILIGVHGGNNGTEPMTVPGYNAWLNKYIEGFPQAWANRVGEIQLAGRENQYYEPVNEYFTSFPAYADINLNVTVSADRKSANITSNTKFSLETDVKHYLSFVIVEDNVGPYPQQNYYYGANIDLGGWEDVKPGTKVKFNHVARAISEYPGINGSLPDAIEANKDYEYSLSMPLEYSNYGKTPEGKKGTFINPDAFKVIGLIVNAETDEIVNAKELKALGLGVDSVTDDQNQVDIKVVNGDIVVTGTNNFAVYTLDGRKVPATGLESGVYVVKAENKTLKVLVK